LLELRLRWLLIAGSTYAPTTNLTNGTATAAPEYGRIFARPEWAQTDAAGATTLTSFRTNDEAFVRGRAGAAAIGNGHVSHPRAWAERHAPTRSTRREKLRACI
jgi:hypothetical protein